LDHVDSQQYSDIIFNIYTIVYTEIVSIISKESDIAKLYIESDSYDQHFIQVLATFLTTILSKYRMLIESLDGGKESVYDMLIYLLKISQVPEREIWKICLEYWGKLVNIVFFLQSKMSKFNLYYRHMMYYKMQIMGRQHPTMRS
jgi:exportin-1